MTQENELQNVDTQTGEIQQSPQGEVIVQDTKDYTIVKLPDGKFRKDMKYQKYYSHIPESKEDLIQLHKILNTQDDKLVTPMSKIVGETIEIHQVYTNPYESFDENTGGTSNGVTTTIFTGDKYIATSSKAVYYTIMGLFEVFGHPNIEGYSPIKVAVTGTRMQNGTQINLELVSV